MTLPLIKHQDPLPAQTDVFDTKWCASKEKNNVLWAYHRQHKCDEDNDLTALHELEQVVDFGKATSKYRVQLKQ